MLDQGSAPRRRVKPDRGSAAGVGAPRDGRGLGLLLDHVVALAAVDDPLEVLVRVTRRDAKWVATLRTASYSARVSSIADVGPALDRVVDTARRQPPAADLGLGL